MERFRGRENSRIYSSDLELRLPVSHLKPGTIVGAGQVCKWDVLMSPFQRAYLFPVTKY